MTNLKEIESAYQNVNVSKSFTDADAERRGSPGGDAALDFLDKHFTVLEDWLGATLKDGFVKTLIVRQLPYFYMLIRAAVEKALT